MKKNNLVLKVSDLLKKPGKADDISIKNVQLPGLSDISEEGVSADIFLRSTNDQAVYVTLSNISYTQNLVCDLCSKQYTKKSVIEAYNAKFIIDPEQEMDDDAVFYISDDQTIDITPMLEQAIILNNDVANHCPDCEKNRINDDDDELDTFESTSNIRFS